MFAEKTAEVSLIGKTQDVGQLLDAGGGVDQLALGLMAATGVRVNRGSGCWRQEKPDYSTRSDLRAGSISTVAPSGTHAVMSSSNPANMVIPLNATAARMFGEPTKIQLARDGEVFLPLCVISIRGASATAAVACR